MRGRRFSFGLEAYSGVYLLVGFIVLFGIWTPRLFLTSQTASTILSSQAVSALLGLGVLVPLAAGAFDLSIGATANVAAVLVAVLQTNQHWGMWPAILITLAVSAAIGAVNGFVVVKLGVSSLITTLGMGSILAALQVIVSPGQPSSPSTSSWIELAGRSFGGVQIAFFYMLVLAAIVWWLTAHTPFGRYLYAVGANSEAARLSGVRVGRYVWSSLIISSTLGGIGGILYCSQSGPSLTFGTSLLLPAFAAAFLGSTQLRPGRFNVWGTVLAIYVLATGVQGLEFVTSQQWLNSMFNGVALILAVSLAVWRQRHGRGSPRGARSTRPGNSRTADGGPAKKETGEPDAAVSGKSAPVT